MSSIHRSPFCKTLLDPFAPFWTLLDPFGPFCKTHKPVRCSLSPGWGRVDGCHAEGAGAALRTLRIRSAPSHPSAPLRPSRTCSPSIVRWPPETAESPPGCQPLPPVHISQSQHWLLTPPRSHVTKPATVLAPAPQSGRSIARLTSLHAGVKASAAGGRLVEYTRLGPNIGQRNGHQRNGHQLANAPLPLCVLDRPPVPCVCGSPAASALKRRRPLSNRGNPNGRGGCARA